MTTEARNPSGNRGSATVVKSPRSLDNVGLDSSREPVSDIADGGDDVPGPKNIEEHRKAGLFGTSANLVNTIVGAGIIGIPYAFRQSGWIVGLVLLAFVGYLTDKSLRIIIDLATFHPKLKFHHVTTYENLASFPFGRIGRGFILINMFIMAYGAMVAYLLIIKDTVPTLFGVPQGNGGIGREVILIGTSLLVILPLSMQRDMATLCFTSALSVTADLILVIFILIFSPIQETVAAAGGFSEILSQDSIRPTLFIGLGVLSTAMACQHSAFIVSGSLERLTRARWAFVTGWSIALSTLLCTTLGTAGYLGFLEETQGDVLNNFDPDSMTANAARALLAITMFFTYPMEAFVARHVFSSLMYQGELEGTDDMPPILCGTNNGCCNRRHRLTLVIYILTLIPALIFDDLGPVLSITGAIGASSIAYIAPGMIFLGVNGEAFMAYCHNFLSKHGKGSKEETSNGDHIELPVAGDSSQKMPESGGDGQRNIELPVAGRRRTINTLEYHTGPKPCWWWLFGFPIWYGISYKGMRGMQRRLSDEGYEASFQLHDSSGGDGETEDSDYKESDVLPEPKGSDYCGAIVFIVFGVVALVAGLTANIWGLIHGI